MKRQRACTVVFFLFFCLISKTMSSETRNNEVIAKNKTCIGCALQTDEIPTIGGLLDSSRYFKARQDCFVPIPGFIIINSRRHIQSIDDFTHEERIDFIEFIYKIRKKMRKHLSINTIQIIQEENDEHFHIWLFPRYELMESFGNKVTSVIPIMQWAKTHLNTEENLEYVLEAAKKLKQ